MCDVDILHCNDWKDPTNLKKCRNEYLFNENVFNSYSYMYIYIV